MRFFRWFMGVADESSARTNAVFLLLFVGGLMMNVGLTAGAVYDGDRVGTASCLLACMVAVALIANETRALVKKRRGDEPAG